MATYERGASFGRRLGEFCKLSQGVSLPARVYFDISFRYTFQSSPRRSRTVWEKISLGRPRSTKTRAVLLVWPNGIALRVQARAHHSGPISTSCEGRHKPARSCEEQPMQNRPPTKRTKMGAMFVGRDNAKAIGRPEQAAKCHGHYGGL
jgi:hypothetical protein